jgi:hypothetical protein
LQVIEMSVGVGVGFIFLAREGLSFATLKRIEQEEEQAAIELVEETPPTGPQRPSATPRTRSDQARATK